MKPSGTKTGIFWDKWVDTLAADVLTPCCITRSSAAKLLTIDDTLALVFPKVRFHLSVGKQKKIQVYFDVFS